MIFVDGYPVMKNATDAMDSAMLAGMMATFDHPDMSPQLLSKYVNQDGEVVRCPAVMHDGDYSQNKNNVTRDQMVPVCAGLNNYGLYHITNKILQATINRGWRAQNSEADKPGSKKKFPNGADWFSPSQRNFMRRSAMVKTNKLGRISLWLDIAWNCYVQPWSEPNQLICMMMTAKNHIKRMKWWISHHPDWRRAIKQYYCDVRIGKYDRGEKDFADFLISEIEKRYL